LQPMFLRKFFLSFLLTPLFLLLSNLAFCETRWTEFAVAINGKLVEEFSQKSSDSLFLQHNVFGTTIIKSVVGHLHVFNDQSHDFYLLLFLFLFLGIIRIADPKYFFEILKSFLNKNISNRQSKDRILQKSFSNFLMNFFFILTASTFCYYYMKLFLENRFERFSSSYFHLSLVGISVLYLGKFLVIKFIGWAFNVEELTEQHLFNVFLLNKILGVTMLPFVFLIVFSIPTVSTIALQLSLLLIVTAFIVRYLRSWKVFCSFYNFSKFHFFTYICASELMPIAVLVKLLTHGVN
jgi:hypothetical protein